MLVVVVLHTAIILSLMVPSFTALFRRGMNFAEIIVVSILVHAFAGVVADIFGIWLVASWRLREDMKACFAKIASCGLQ